LRMAGSGPRGIEPGRKHKPAQFPALNLLRAVRRCLHHQEAELAP
jgi:hypothetical protein